MEISEGIVLVLYACVCMYMFVLSVLYAWATIL